MANIRVDHSVFERTASAVDECVNGAKAEMKSADATMGTLGSGWQGADYLNFKKQWDEVMNPNSAYKKYVDALESYAELLRFAAKEYKRAQADAVNRANSLPR